MQDKGLQYHGLLRVGELGRGAHPILANSVYVAKNRLKFQFVLRSSKTHSRASKPQKVEITNCSTVGQYCPYKLIRSFITVRPKRKNEDDPFFIFSDGSQVRPHHIRAVLRKAILKIGLNQKLYSTHSLRSGRACDLLRQGMEVQKIKLCGRWRSNAVYKYLK